MRSPARSGSSSRSEWTSGSRARRRSGPTRRRCSRTSRAGARSRSTRWSDRSWRSPISCASHSPPSGPSTRAPACWTGASGAVSVGGGRPRALFRLGGEEDAPPLGVDLPLHQLAAVRRQEVQALVAFLRSLGLLLILDHLLGRLLLGARPAG